MRVESINLQNFGSYQKLSLKFGKGLTLIQGPNGAGKSTIFDALTWVLFGKTAKGGKSDEVRSWNAEEVTVGWADLDSTRLPRVHRARSPNDLLYYGPGGSTEKRGKDQSDTQRIIDKELGFRWDLYQRGAYYHEFSETAQFFTASAKQRRDLCESLVDFSLALKIQGNASSEIKKKEILLTAVTHDLNAERNKIKFFTNKEESELRKMKQWREDNERAIKKAEETVTRFEENRRRVITNKCNRCGTTLSAPKEVFDDSPNPYTAYLEELRRAECPYDGIVRDYQSEIQSARRNIEDMERRERGLIIEINDLENLLEVIQSFRGVLIRNTIDYLTSETNKLIREYFDGELSLQLEIEGADKLDITIQKDGNIAAFTQLSKGQRQILKLCFSVAVMEAISSHHGVKFEQLFFDEALDGLSDTMKVKSFRLFEFLRQSHEDVFVIDHSEALKVLFPNTITVSIEDGNSVINAVS